MSRRTGAARQNALFSSEYGVPDLRFEASIHGVLSGLPFIDKPETHSLVLLIAALSRVLPVQAASLSCKSLI